MARKIKLTIAAVVMVVALLAVTVTLVMSRGTAQAAAPLILVQSVDQVFDVLPGDPGSCTFPLHIEFTGTAHIRLYFDASGNVTRILITGADVTGTFTNVLTGASVWTPSPNMVLRTFNSDGSVTQSLRGLLDHVVIPGQGLVTADVGRLDLTDTPTGVQVTFLAGQQDNNFGPTICSVLG